MASGSQVASTDLRGHGWPQGVTSGLVGHGWSRGFADSLGCFGWPQRFMGGHGGSQVTSGGRS
jgi:hypothetical protein